MDTQVNEQSIAEVTQGHTTGNDPRDMEFQVRGRAPGAMQQGGGHHDGVDGSETRSKTMKSKK
jgi:hypothetical protein